MQTVDKKEKENSTTPPAQSPAAETKPLKHFPKNLKLNPVMHSPTDKMMSPATRQLQGKHFLKHKGLRPKLLNETFEKAKAELAKSEE